MTSSQSGALQARDSHKGTAIGGLEQKDSAMVGIIILLTPAPITDFFRVWKQEMSLVGGIGCLELCLYSI